MIKSRNESQTQGNGRSKIAEAGFGLIEVMVAAAIISIIALGIGTLIDDMMRAQKKANTSAAIGAMRARLIAAIQDGQSWQQTTSDATENPDMTCMRSGGAACADGASAALNLKDATGQPLYYARTANHGFNYDGVVCTNYPNNDCVFRWTLRWAAVCPGAVDPCPAPTVTVLADLEHTPGVLTLPGGFNSASYRIQLQRGTAAIRNDAVTVANVVTGNGGEGQCTATWGPRQLNRFLQDPGDNLLNKTGTNSLSTANRVRLRAGTYNCRVQAPAFKNGTNRLRIAPIVGPGIQFTPVESSSATAPMNGGSATLIIETTLVFSTDTSFVVEQRCDSRPSAASPPGFGSTNDNWSLGVPTGDSGSGYSNVTYTTVNCARTS